MKLTRTQLAAFRAPNCHWGSEAETLDAFEARFPGGGPIDIAELIQSWLDDTTLNTNTLYHCAAFARRIAKCKAGNARMNPKQCLETVLAHLASPPE